MIFVLLLIASEVNLTETDKAGRVSKWFVLVETFLNPCSVPEFDSLVLQFEN